MKYHHLVPSKMGPKKSILQNSVDANKQFTVSATFQEIEFLTTLLPRCFAFEKLGGKDKKAEKNMTELKKLGSV